jgi:hypothetical protein
LRFTVEAGVVVFEDAAGLPLAARRAGVASSRSGRSYTDGESAVLNFGNDEKLT